MILMPYVGNVRIGFASNSSSYHSIVMGKLGMTDDPDGPEDYGWAWFVAASPEAKLRYAVATLYANISAEDDVYRRDILDSILGRCGYTYSEECVPGIDHESVLRFPRRHGARNQIHEEFVKDFITFMMRDDVTVLGGNDNDTINPFADVLEHTDRNGLVVSLPRDTRDDFIARWDPLGYWTTFYKRTGMKTRGSFHQGTLFPHASAPELVDIKITDFCDKGCAYCYQGSTVRGAHANTHTVYDVITTLSKLEVFEIAIGGGEPTSHPNFSNILAHATSRGIVPNFTTRSLAWLDDNRVLSSVLKCCGGWAYSVDTPDDIQELYDALTLHEVSFGRGYSPMVSVQYIVGVHEHECTSIVAILKKADECGFNVTLLGFKDVGRGVDAEQFSIEGTFEAVCAFATDHFISIGVDTALALSWPMTNIDPRLYMTTEGTHSCYIDATALTMNASSYANTNPVELTFEKRKRTFDRGAYTEVDFQRTAEAWKGVFQQFAAHI